MDNAPPPSLLRRRIMTGFGIAAVGGWVWGAPRLRGLFGPDLRFADIPGAAGFQILQSDIGGGVSAGLFAGLTPQTSTSLVFDTVAANPCEALFRGSSAQVPIAIFSDFNCPNCPQMDANVAAVVVRTPQTSLSYHQLPLLGRTSVTASRAVLAAARQGKYAQMHDALLRSPAVTDMALLRRFAQQSGLDVTRFVQDMSHPEILGSLAVSDALAQYLGLVGTPATVIGQTVVLGVETEATITAIIAHEIEKGATCS